MRELLAECHDEPANGDTMANDPSPARLRVLVVDDDSVRDALQQVLSQSPRLRVITDAKPEHIRALLERQPPQVVLAGTHPRHRALSLLAELASLQPERRPFAIAHLTRHSPGDWLPWRALGFDGYVLKEIGSAGLADRLLAAVADIRTITG